MNNNLELAKILLKNGAQKEANNIFGKTALMCCTINKSEVFQLLNEKKAEKVKSYFENEGVNAEEDKANVGNPELASAKRSLAEMANFLKSAQKQKEELKTSNQKDAPQDEKNPSSSLEVKDSKRLQKESGSNER